MFLVKILSGDFRWKFIQYIESYNCLYYYIINVWTVCVYYKNADKYIFCICLPVDKCMIFAYTIIKKSK